MSEDSSDRSQERDQDHDHDHGDDGHGNDHDPDHGHDHDHHHRGDEHHQHDRSSVGVAIVTVSSTRTLEDDPSGDLIASAFESAGHEVVTRELIPDDFDRIQDTIAHLAGREDTDAIVTTGGTGVTPDDVTPEAVEPILDKRLAGFGELFRQFSYEEVGTRSIGSRAIGGITDETPVFCLPGSENAVRLGVEELILPEIGHLAGLAGRSE